MKIIKKVLLIIISMIILSSCGIKTPEELIEPPEVDLERKKIMTIVNSFLPANSEIINAANFSPTNTLESVLSVNLNNDSDDEIIAIYRDKNTRYVSFIILELEETIWTKKLEIKFDSADISDYFVVDLNNDGKNEVIIGYYEDTNKKIQIITNNEFGEYEISFKEQYMALNLRKDNDRYFLAISGSDESHRNNKLSVLLYEDDKFLELAKYVYDENIDIYKVEYTNISSSQKGYILDIYKDLYQGTTDILIMEDNVLKSIIKDEDKNLFSQNVLTMSSDINGDGIVDINGNEIVLADENNQAVIINRYYNISDKEDIILLKTLYEDNNAGIKIDFKSLDTSRIKIDKENYKNIKFYYVDNNSNKIKFLELIKINLARDILDLEEYEIIKEDGQDAIIAKFEYPNSLYGLDKSRFDKIYYEMKKNDDLIKFVE